MEGTDHPMAKLKDGSTDSRVINPPVGKVILINNRRRENGSRAKVRNLKRSKMLKANMSH